MTDNLPDHIQAPPAPHPARLGQATAVEQSRAVAQVQAAAVMARQFPRNVQLARTRMQEVCRLRKLADKAFYSYKRAGQTVSGPSVHLARELARLWGNIDYGIAEMARDDVYGQSEMIAWAWDLEVNTRVSNTFIVPHRRDVTVDGKATQKPILDLRSIYESNTNAAARRLREAIFDVVPVEFSEEAQQVCQETLEKGDGKPLNQQISEMIEHYAERWQVSQVDIERALGREAGRWTQYDMAELRKTWTSLTRREITREEAFPSPQIRGADLLAGARPAAVAPAPAVVPDAGVGPTAEDIATWNAEGQQ